MNKESHEQALEILNGNGKLPDDIKQKVNSAWPDTDLPPEVKIACAFKMGWSLAQIREDIKTVFKKYLIFSIKLDSAEPVAWMHKCDQGSILSTKKNELVDVKGLFGGDVIPLYAQPAQRNHNKDAREPSYETLQAIWSCLPPELRNLILLGDDKIALSRKLYFAARGEK